MRSSHGASRPKSNRRLVAPALTFLAALVLPATAWMAETRVLVLNDTNEPPFTNAQRNGAVDRLATEAFRRVGLELRLVKLPAERGLMSANAGILDGDLTRIAGLEARYPNLIRVPEKVSEWNFVAFSRDPSLPATVASLRGRDVGFVRGWRIFHQEFAGPGAIAANTPLELFGLIRLNRIEVALYERAMGLEFVRLHGIKGVTPLAPSLHVREMYIYLHQRHAELVPKLAQALREVRNEGFQNQAEREMLPSNPKESRK